MSTTRYLPMARMSANLVLQVLEQRSDTNPQHVQRWLLIEDHGEAWLFAVLNDRFIPNLKPYLSADLHHHLSTVLRGKPVVHSNHSGVRLAILLSGKHSLPQQAAFPGWRSGLVQIGIGVSSQGIVTDWEGLGHVLAAGMTGSGKSNFLRLLAVQAIAEGHRLLLADLRGRTFSLLEGHSNLLAPVANDPEACASLVQQAMGLMNERAALYQAAPGSPETLAEYNAAASQPLPRLVVVLNEYNSMVVANGGPKSELARNVTLLTAQGRGYGINVILAGQMFTREVVGAAQDQCRTRLCFQVQKPSTSSVVLGRFGAERLKVPGRALSDPWGLLQVYSLPKEALLAAPGNGLSQAEQKLAAQLVEHHAGRMSFEALGQLGHSRRPAERLRNEWRQRGLAVQVPGEDNALCVAPHIRQLCEQAGPSARAWKTVQTAEVAHVQAF